MGCMYATVLFLDTQNSSSVQPVVVVGRTIFYRERAAGIFSLKSLYVIMQAVLCDAIMYAMIGFEWTVRKFFWYLFILFFTLLHFTSHDMMTIAVTPNASVAQIVGSFFYGIWNLFSGFIVP
ncbi:transcription factor [Datura stramonium]|uniref:Transcription factor n=1 Tax=Datura stramonium TaxID=4076 RepID=A0ABS8RGL8_DATST|nr:transcription factor [Datura stramonium]